jgi:uncharacterized membrane protein YfcA
VRLTRRDAADIKRAKEAAAATAAAKAANDAPALVIITAPRACAGDDNASCSGSEIGSSGGTSTSGDDAAEAAAVGCWPRARAAVQRWGKRLRKWRAVQPVKLQLLVLGVVALHTGGTVLAHAAAKPCSRELWAIKGAMGGAMVVLTVVAGALVLRWTRAAADAADAATTDAQAANAEEGATIAAAAAPSPASWRDGNYDFIRWRLRDLLLMPLPMVVIGIIAGCLGLGGGFLMVPLLLALGAHPQVQAGTCKVVLLISTAASTLSLLVGGRLPITYGLVYGITNLLAAPLGITTFNWVIHRTGRPSLLVALNVARFAVGTTLMFAFAAVPAWRRAALGLEPLGLQLQNLCQVAAK